MCGIAGIVDCGAGFGAQAIGRIATAMRDTLIHRGPDDAGTWVSPDGVCALAHRRLSILDLSPDGRQPMGNEDGNVHVTFNGEIYNYVPIRERLEAAGHRLFSHSDTAVLPHLFEEMDGSRFSELEGMFGIALWRCSDRTLLLGRDAFGKKPLYYAQGAGWFAFASELSALRKVPEFDATIDPEALEQYLMLQYVPAPNTIYRGARKLPPGCYLELKLKGTSPSLAIGSHFRFDAGAGEMHPRTRTLDDEVELLRELTMGAVGRRLASDVPLGAFLSGGVDSTLVVAMMAKELGRKVKTFSIGFQGTDETEHIFAQQVARHLNTEHYEELLKPDALEMISLLAQTLDEPLGDSSCLPSYLLSRMTRKHVTVALSGDGGDEMFGGYGRYSDVINEAGQMAGKPEWSPGKAYVSERWLIFTPEDAQALTGRHSPAVADILGAWRHALDTNDRALLHRMRNLDVKSYMPGSVLTKVDRVSMQFALEVRCPLLDKSVARFAEGVSAENCWQPGESKRILKKLASRYVPGEWMNRKKMGFGLPSNSWSQAKVLDFARDMLLGARTQLSAHVDAAALKRLVNHQSEPGCFSIFKLWTLLIVELWLRAHHATPLNSAGELK